MQNIRTTFARKPCKSSPAKQIATCTAKIQFHTRLDALVQSTQNQRHFVDCFAGGALRKPSKAITIELTKHSLRLKTHSNPLEWRAAGEKNREKNGKNMCKNKEKIEDMTRENSKKVNEIDDFPYV